MKPAVERQFVTCADRPLAMLAHCPAYAPAPLRDVPDLAAESGVATLWIKDESQRMRLGSFKALGGAFAVAQIIADTSGETDLMSEATKQAAAGMTFVTASAGNHGLSVAAGARVFGAQSAVVLCAAVPEAFSDRIRALGSRVIRVEGSYEDSVAYASSAAETNGWIHLADGSWPGYIERPALVMEGYTVLAEECRHAFARQGNWPNHVILQAGVGGFAAAVAANIRENWPEQPRIVVVEPEAAPCVMESVRAARLTRTDGPVSNMGRLDCKDASLIAFQSLRHDADRFVTISDREAVAAVDLFRRHEIFTTPSGAAGLAALRKLDPNGDRRCLIVVTEGREEG